MVSGSETVDMPMRATLSRAAPFACLYVSFGATFGVIGTGAPLVFRAHGMSLGAIGLLQVISLPVGVTFLWAPLIDQLRWPGLPHRLGWIAASQIVTVALLLVLSRGAEWPPAFLFAMAVAVATALATMDVALEALVVDSVSRAERPVVTTAKLVGSSLGTALGVSLVTAWPQVIDLPRAVLLVACLDVFLMLPMLRHGEQPRRPERLAATDRGPRAARERLRAIGGHAAVLGVYFGTALLLGSTSSLALIDLGVSLPVAGLVTGAASTALSIGAMLLSGLALTRLPAHRLIIALAVGAAAAGLLLAGAAALHLAGLAIAATLVHVAFDAAVGVPVFNTMYRWAEGGHAAADYALLFGTAFLVAFPVRVAGPALASMLGWPLFFALGVPLYLAAVAVLARAMMRTNTCPA